MATVKITIYVETKETPNSLFKARALMKRIKPVEITKFTTGEITIRAKTESIYRRCEECRGTFRTRADGHVIRHGCSADED